jgi:hypothetical protein
MAYTEIMQPSSYLPKQRWQRPETDNENGFGVKKVRGNGGRASKSEHHP